MKAHTVTPTLPPRTPRLVVIIAMAVLLSAASFQSAWAQTSPSLGAAAPFAILAGAGVTDAGAASTVYGSVGSDPTVSNDLIAGQVIAPGVNYTAANVAVQNAKTAAFAASIGVYDLLANQTTSLPATTFEKSTVDLAGEILGPGVYHFASTANLSGTLTLNGNANSVFIFNIVSGLNINGPSAVVKLTGGVQPCNVWWRVGSTAVLGATVKVVGNILANTSITMGNATELNGRALASTGSVTLINNDIFFSACLPGTTGEGDEGPFPGCPDTTLPTINAQLFPQGSGLHQVLLTVHDAGGLASISELISTNSTITIPGFAVATTGPVVVTAVKDQAGIGSVIGLSATDLCGNVKNFDPVDFTIKANKTVTVKNIPRVEHFVKILNDGLQALVITVNGNHFKTVWLEKKETRTIDIGRAMVPGDNTIKFEAFGYGRNGQAVIFVNENK